jgi:hypothetical protein
MTLGPNCGVVKISSVARRGGDSVAAGLRQALPGRLRQRWRPRRRLLGGARRGRANYEPRRQCDVQRLELVAIHEPDQQADCHAA